MVPPSIHPCGETLEWEEYGEPAKVDGNKLLDCVARSRLHPRRALSRGVVRRRVASIRGFRREADFVMPSVFENIQLPVDRLVGIGSVRLVQQGTLL
jgi:hypothetical protein